MAAGDRASQVADAARVLVGFAGSSAGAPAASGAMALFATGAAKPRSVSVEVTFLRAPQPNRVPLYFDLPHEIHSRGSICLITPAPQRQYKEELETKQADQSVSKVMDVVKLNAKYTNAVARRALAKAFDVFFVHSDVKEYPQLLTGEFLTRQTPVWMDSKPGDLVDRIARTKCRAVCPRRGYDNCSIAVGDADMSVEQIEANVQALLDGLAAELDGGWKDILSVRVSASNKAGQRVALPVYAHDFSESAGFAAVESTPEKKAGKKRTR